MNHFNTTPAVSGIFLMGNNTRKALVADNTILNIVANNTQAINNIAAGVFINKTSIIGPSAYQLSQMVFERNFIADIRNNSGLSSAQRAGIVIFQNRDAIRHFRNNVIAIHPQTSQIMTYGFSKYTLDAYGHNKGSNKFKLYNNTIMVDDGESNAQTAVVQNMIDVKNNIMVNYTTHTGASKLHTALRYRADTVSIIYSIEANNMIVKASTAAALVRDLPETYVDIAAWQSIKTTDTLSQSADPKFTDSSSLLVEDYKVGITSKGIVMTDYTTDFENAPRTIYMKGAFESSSSMSWNALTFELSLNDKQLVELKWVAIHEDNIDSYEIMSSDNTIDWQSIHSTSVQNRSEYNYVDISNLQAKRFYKIVAHTHQATSLSSVVK